MFDLYQLHYYVRSFVPESAGTRVLVYLVYLSYPLHLFRCSEPTTHEPFKEFSG
jgi:hypothetical protein